MDLFFSVEIPKKLFIKIKKEIIKNCKSVKKYQNQFISKPLIIKIKGLEERRTRN